MLTLKLGTPDERIEATTALYADGKPAEEKVEECVKLAEEMQELRIFGNRHTPYTIPTLEARKKQYGTAIDNFLNSLKEVMTTDSICVLVFSSNSFFVFPLIINYKEKEVNARSLAAQEELSQREKLEEERLNFEKRSNDLKIWIDNTTDSLNDPIDGTSHFY